MSSFTAKKHSGFTLIELMVVIVIIAIVAAVAVPSYRSSVRKAKRVQAKTTLVVASQRLEKCFTENGTYVATSGGVTICDTDAELTAAGDNSDGNYTIAYTRNAADFTITATATSTNGQDEDTGCGRFEIKSTGAKTSYKTTNYSTFTENTNLGDCW